MRVRYSIYQRRRKLLRIVWKNNYKVIDTLRSELKGKGEAGRGVAVSRPQMPHNDTYTQTYVRCLVLVIVH